MYRDDHKDRVYLPRGKWEYDRKTRVKNWFYYFKWWLLGGIAGAVFLVYLVCRMLGVGVVKPDYTVGIVSRAVLPEEVVRELEDQLTLLGQDLNGDGIVKVTVNQFMVSGQESPNIDVQFAMANSVRLQADLVSKDSYFFILEEPDWFQREFSILAAEDGSYAGEEVKTAEGLAFPWRDCPGLESMELSETTEKMMYGMYFARRGFQDYDEVPYREEYEIFWRLLTQGEK